MKELELAISPEGTITMIYDDSAAGLIEQAANPVICRVSHVEPSPLGGWRVEMIGDSSHEAFCLNARTFSLRSDALAAEVEYLRNRLFR